MLAYAPNSGIENLFLPPDAVAAAAVQGAAAAVGAVARQDGDGGDYGDYDYGRRQKTTDYNYEYVDDDQPNHNSLNHGTSSYTSYTYEAPSYSHPGHSVTLNSFPGKKVSRYGSKQQQLQSSNSHTSGSDGVSSYTSYSHHTSPPSGDHTTRSDAVHGSNGPVTRYSAYGHRRNDPGERKTAKTHHRNRAPPGQKKVAERLQLGQKKAEKRNDLSQTFIFGETWEGIMGPHLQIVQDIIGHRL